MRATTFSLLCLLYLAASAPSPARACSGPVCVPDSFLPLSGSVPANLPGFYWRAGFNWDSDLDGGFENMLTQPGELSLRCTSPKGSQRDVPLHVDDTDEHRPRILVPDAALVEGESCVLTTVFEPCTALPFSGPPIEGLTGRSELSIAAATPLPTTFGTLRADDARERTVVLAEGAGCEQYLSLCAIEVTAELATGTEPWAGLLVFETLVDGKPWRHLRAENLPNVLGGSFVGRGVDTVFIDSRGYVSALTPGAHTVTMRATLPGTAIVLESGALEIDLTCATTSGADGGELDVDAGAPRDAGGASADPTDASGPSTDGEREGASDEAASESGCSAGGAPASGASVWWSIGGLLAMRWSRRRRVNEAQCR